ncbi:hypothetical protein, partial [Xanthomonas vesicatoria]|uniref:hypothetical protein n=1 Tax=Xanthomonas vesicatoria TaxID=56460 RepID=UPI001F1BCB81
MIGFGGFVSIQRSDNNTARVMQKYPAPLRRPVSLLFSPSARLRLDRSNAIEKLSITAHPPVHSAAQQAAALQAPRWAVGLAPLACGTAQPACRGNSFIAARNTPSPETRRKRSTEAPALSPIVCNRAQRETDSTCVLAYSRT